MSVYVDPLRSHPKRNRYGNVWCHMMADSHAELRRFAESIGIPRCWFDRDHYDLNPFQRNLALKAGAEAVRSQFLIGLRRRGRQLKMRATP